MSHWPHTPEREDGDGHDETHDKAKAARNWLRGLSENSQVDFIRGITGDLRALELAASGFYLGIDDDTEDCDDVDDIGPF